MTEEDKLLFLSAVTDATPIKPINQPGEYSQKRTKKMIQTTLKKVKKKQYSTSTPFKVCAHLNTNRPGSVGAFDSIYYHQKSIRIQELSKLKKGDFSIEGVLDLHGKTLEMAEYEIIAFISEAVQYKKRYIRIIHGKGYNSEEPYPVIKNLVNQILRTIQPVLAFYSTPQKDGGTGAVNIFLKAG